MSIDLTDAIGKVVTGSATLYVRGGGLFHTVLVATDGGALAIYWDRNDNRFRTVELTDAELDTAEREWSERSERRTTNMHNTICSCSDCETRRQQFTVPPPQLQAEDGPVEGPSLPPPDWMAPEVPAPVAQHLADQALALAALAARLEASEAGLKALRLAHEELRRRVGDLEVAKLH